MADKVGSRQEMEGSVAEDAAVGTTNPMIGGGRANENEPTRVSADGDAVLGWSDRVGRDVVQPQFPANLVTATHGPCVCVATVVGDTVIIAAPGAGVSIHVLSFWLSNNATTKRKVALREGVAGEMRVRGTLAADGGGVKHSYQTPWKLPANTELAVNLDAGGDIEVNVEFYVAA